MLPAQGAFATSGGVRALDGVPRIDPLRYPCTFAACLMSALTYLGDTPSYDEILAVSGAAFRRFWHPDDPSADNPLYLGREVFRRTFRALGRGYDELVSSDPAVLGDALRRTLDEGRPAISYRVDVEKGTVITGYDPSVRRAFGWSSGAGPRDVVSAVVHHPNAERGILVIGERIGPPCPRETLASTLDWAVDLARSSRHLAWPDHVTGLSAYDAWIEALSARSDPALFDRHLKVFRAQVRMLRERASAAEYLNSIARIVPDVRAELERAAKLLIQVAAAAARLLSGSPESLRRALSEPRRRLQLASAVRAAARNENRAVELLETALERLDPLPERTVLPTPARPRALLDRARAPESVPTPIALRAACELLGESPGGEAIETGSSLIDPTHVLLMGITGRAFAWEWLPLPGMRPDKSPELCESAPVRHYERVLHALGLDGEVLLAEVDGVDTDETWLRARITRTLYRRKLPVVLFTNGPGVGERLLVAGYDDGGAALIGWATSAGGPSITFAPERRVTARRWFAATRGVLLIKSRGPRANLDRVYRGALDLAVKLLTRTENGPYHSGAAMYAAWSEAIVDPSVDGDNDRDATDGPLNELVDPLIWDLAERRWYGSLFLSRAAQRFPDAADQLERAATELRAVHDLMHDINATAGGRWPGDQLPELHRPEVRRSMSTLMVQAAEHDLRAAVLIERALPHT